MFFLRRRKPTRVVIWLNTNGKLKLVMSVVLVMLTLFLFTHELPATRTWTYWTMPLSGKVIALDPGHGGPDGGAVGAQGQVEKEINLAISLYLRDYLQQMGAIVVMTRESDRDLAQEGTKGYSKRKTEDLLSRAELIKRHHADLLISIHVNSIPQAKWRGAQTFYASANVEGKRLAETIQQELREGLGNTDRVVKTEDQFYLLKTSDVPAALVEVGFLSNPEEAALLGSDLYQRKVAEAIYRGIARYASDSGQTR